jgi:hypothetical protein
MCVCVQGSQTEDMRQMTSNLALWCITTLLLYYIIIIMIIMLLLLLLLLLIPEKYVYVSNV